MREGKSVRKSNEKKGKSRERFRLILTDRRHNFINANLERILIVNFNAHILE